MEKIVNNRLSAIEGDYIDIRKEKAKALKIKDILHKIHLYNMKSNIVGMGYLTIKEQFGEAVLVDCDEDTEEVIIPNFVSEISSYAFYDCTNLTRVTLPHKLTIIRGHTFSDCDKIKRIELPENVEYIRQGAFENCRLEEIVLNKTIKKIEYGAFFGGGDIYMGTSYIVTDERLYKMVHNSGIPKEIIKINK